MRPAAECRLVAGDLRQALPDLGSGWSWAVVMSRYVVTVAFAVRSFQTVEAVR
jgi:hypothetical protein